MNMNVRIKGMDIYHPKNGVKNDYYVDHFKKVHGNDYTSFLNDILGRDNRYIIDNEEENTLTMAIEATKKVLFKSDISAEEIDMIYFVSQSPEYIFPTNAALVHQAIKGNPYASVLDVNGNCSGMTIALEQAMRVLSTNPRMRYVLIVGSDNASYIMDPNDSITYPNFGDSACAIILERVEEEVLFDTIHYIDSSDASVVTFPEEGMNKFIKGKNTNPYVKWNPFPGDVSLPSAYDMMNTLIKRNNLEKENVKAFCLSQFSIGNINKIRDELNLKDEQMIYIGDKFGYTGTTSPLMALHAAIEDGRIQKGDKVILWTVGVGWHSIAILLEV